MASLLPRCGWQGIGGTAVSPRWLLLPLLLQRQLLRLERPMEMVFPTRRNRFKVVTIVDTVAVHMQDTLHRRGWERRRLACFQSGLEASAPRRRCLSRPCAPAPCWVVCRAGGLGRREKVL
jgi:hypothetical protein